MNFDLTDDQRAIQRTAREFLADRYRPEEIRRLALEDERGFTDEQWEAIVELGWPAMVVPEDAGGLGLGHVELAVLQEQMGYALAPSPFLSNVAATLLLAAAGQSDRLGAVAAGEQRGTVAQWDADAGWSPTEPTLQPDGSRLTGTKIAVPDAGSADFLVVTAAPDRHFVVDARADGVTSTPTSGLDPTRKLFDVRLDGVDGTELRADADAWERAWAAIATATAAESVGVAHRAMDMAVEYAKDREQFGRPIGAYQAVSHACAQMLLEVEGARSATLYAAWTLDHEPRSARLTASMAKAYASDAGWRVTASSLQVHGGIGFTWEHDLHFFLKRARANAAAWGDARWHRARVADIVAA